MSNIFISYRREDSAAYAGRIYDRITQRFHAEQVFMDVDTVQPGLDFVEAIENAVKSCAVLIAVIGKSWLDAADQHGRRLDNPEDLVRVEICTALERKIRVIPVLVDGARMPHSKDLPDCLKPLARRAAMEISHTRFAVDADLLVQALGKALGAVASPETPKSPAGTRKSEKAADDLLSRLTALAESRVEGLALPSAIYGGIWLAPDASTVYLTRFREKKEYSVHYDLIGYDMTSGRTSLLGDVGTDSHYDAAFDGTIFYKSAGVEKYKTRRILRFEGARRIAGFDERLIVSLFSMIGRKVVYEVGDRWFWRDARGAQYALDFGRNFHVISWSDDLRGLALLRYFQGEKKESSEQLYEHRLVSLDEQLNVTNTLWTHADTNTCRFAGMHTWTENACLFVEGIDSDHDGRVTYKDRRNCRIKSLDLASGEISTVVPDPVELRFIAGHPSGLILLADEIAKDRHVRLEAHKGGNCYEILNLRGGDFRSFCLDGNWETLVYKRVADTTGKGNFFDSEDESEVFRIKLTPA